MPELFIITGSNGAGKSTIGPKYLPHHIRERGPVFDGDKLFVEKRKELWRNIKSHKECAKLAYAFVSETFDQLVDVALTTNQDFAYEGHFTNEATWDIPRRFLAAGYTVHLIFLGLQDTTLSELRVVDRSQSGGHYVDPRTVADNFYGNLEKLNRHYSMFQTVQIIDTSEAEHVVLAVIENGMPTIALPFEKLPSWFQNDLPSITEKIRGMGREVK
ncbi:zeta toxin family protein [Puia sp. P3]|uniref:zeta toxin family protein n=1 Tax=Puia sp. P3 TaxID=3423952 RepID=UPI003D677187